ncbi:MAG: hypothetical protein JSU77_09200 [Fidelibacterota bacterium]|nr:MAG: hypothetical protein JSU77_09200 [Candidatus Neomarinimicrobiota bacterium]
MDRRLCISLILIVSLLVLIVGGCRTLVEPETPDYVEYGWELMADSSYREAIGQFEAGTDMNPSYADGWNGLGWAYARLGVADTSELRFTTAATKSDTTIVGTEILAGRSFARLALGQFSYAVSDAKGALALTPAWTFRRDITITYQHLYLTAATGYYGQGKFDSCLVWVKQLDSSFNTDVATLSGRSRLAAKLEALKSGL